MKPMIPMLLALLVATPCAFGDDPKAKPAPEGFQLTDPPRVFSSIDEMKRWGNSSAFGGGGVSEAYTLGRHTVYVVHRMHTSGVLTAEVSIYTVNDDGKGVSLALFQPARCMGVSSKVVDDTIVCESRDPETGKTRTILTVTRHLFDFKLSPPR